VQRTGPWRAHSGPQLAFLGAQEFEVLYGGAKGGAKTESLVMAPLQQIENPHYKGLLLRAVDSELQEIMDRCAHYYPNVGGTWDAGENRWVFPSGAKVRVGHYENARFHQRYQGQEWTDILFDELGNLAKEADWELLLTEIRSPDKSIVYRARGTANPGGPGHAWLKRRFVTATNRGLTIYTDPLTGLTRRFIPSRVSDNPIYANDARYMAVLMGLPDVKRRQLLEGDWDAGEGMALDELSRSRHFIQPFNISADPREWYRWGALDVGYSHRWCFVHGAMDCVGRAYVVDSLHGWRDRWDEIAVRIKEETPYTQLHTIVTDSYAKQETGGHRDRTPTVKDVFYDYGVRLDDANQKRISGLNNLRMYLAWRLHDGKEKKPRLRFFDTPGNRRTFDCLEAMVLDEAHPEDVLKVHSDANGEGGDDPYDALRYLMAGRPFVPDPPPPPPPTWFDQDPIAQGGKTFEDEFEQSDLGSFASLPTGF
jgi:hypothetical protein